MKKKANTQKNKVKEKEGIALQKSIAMMAAIGFIINSITASGAVTAGNTLVPTIKENGNVTDVWAGKVQGENAFNRFEKFDVEAGKIVNMYFKQQGGINEANRLFNFVNSQIKVNGTVNAIKNNKIGGDLYFLSSDGMVVGNTGVINTGSLYVLAPSTTKYHALLANATGENFADEIDSINEGQIPLNPKGTITVRGQINAVNHIGLYAGKVEIGNVGIADKSEGKYIDKVNLKTGVTDFGKLVNLEGVNSGLDTGKLTAQQTGDGNVVLVAKADSSDEIDQFFNEYLGNESSAAPIKIDNVVARDIKAEVTIKGKVEASGDITAKAEATNGSVLAVEETTGEKVYNSNPLVSTTATVNIDDGAVLTGKNIDIDAITENKYLEMATATGGSAGATASLGTLTNPVKLNGSIGALKGDAQVNIRENTKLTAENDININAKSDVSLTLGASTSAKKSLLVKLKGIKDSITGGETNPGLGAKLPTTALALGTTESNASVNIEGTLESGKDINISANSYNDLDLNSVAMAKDNSIAVIGLNIGVGDNNASVNLENATVKAKENLKIESEAKNSLNSVVEVVAGNKSIAATALNLVAYNSSSKLNIKDSNVQTEEGNIDINSKNTIAENTIISNNNAGKKKSLLKKLLKDELTAIKDLEQSKILIDNIKNKVGLGENAAPAARNASTGDTTGGDTSTGTTEKAKKKKGIGDRITLGASMAFVGEENDSSVNIQGSSITAGNNVNITSKTEVQDTLMSVAGDTVGQGKEKLLVAAGVLYGQMGNTSSIMIDGEDGVSSSTITATNGNVKIESNTEMNYNRVNRMVEQLKESIAALKAAKDELAAYLSAETLEELKTALAGLEEEITKFENGMSGVELDSIFSEEGVYKSADMIMKAQKVQECLSAVQEAALPTQEIAAFTTAISDSIMSIADFANVGNYGNFSVRTTARNAEGTSVAVAGSVSMTNLQNDSKVVIGKNSQITAKNNVDIHSKNETEAINVGGNIGKLVIKGNGGQGDDGATAIGGSFIMQDFDINTVTAIAEGAKIKGSNINIGADSDIFNVDAVLSAGKSAGNAINGMVSYSTGSINNIVSIDDEVLLETNGSETDTKDDKINISANTNAFITNVAGGVAKAGNIGAGIGVAINEFDVNNKIEIKDNDNNEELAILVKHQHKNKVADVIKGASVGDIIFNDDEEDKQNQNIEIKLFDGSSVVVADENKGITANGLSADATTTGMINSVSVAGAISSTSEGEKEKEGILDSLKKDLNGKVNNFNNQLNDVIGKFNESGVVNEFMNKGNSLTPPPASKEKNSPATNNVVNNSETEMKKPTINVAAVGSSSVNLIDNMTTTEIDGVAINLKENNSSVNVSAKDESFNGAWSGAAAVTWVNKKAGAEGQVPSSGKSVGLHGAVGINIADRDTTATIKNTTITDADIIDVKAVNSSVTTVAGLGLGIAKSQGVGNKNYQGGASVSLNDINHNTTALLENVNSSNTVEKDTTDINVNALEDGIQVTGGVNANVGQSSGAVGAAVTVANINNTINAGIRGGNLEDVKNVNVDGTLDITQVTAAAAIGATSSEGNAGVFQGAVVYNGTENTVNSFIDSANIIASENINVTAGDGKTTSEENKYKQTLEGLGIDTTGEGYYSGVDKNLSGEDGTRENIENNKTGSTIVTGAMSVAGSNTNALGAGVVVGNIANNFNAEIKGSSENSITADTVNVAASADTFVVGAAGGVGVGKDTFGGMGSVSWQDLSNNVLSKISGVNITAREVNVESTNNVFEVNSGGQITYGGKAAAGAVLAYSNIDNNTSAAIENTTINLTTEDEEKVKSINVSVDSNIESYNIGAGVAASSGSTAVSGTVAVSQGGNKTSASIEETTIKDVDTINTLATDKNKTYTIVGTISGSKTAAIGGAGAYNEMADNMVESAIRNSNITTDVNGNINVGALDSSVFHTIAAGVGGSGKVAVEGAAAVSTITKNTIATMENVNINSEEDEEERSSNLNISAENNSEIISNASALAGAGKAGIGAGVAVNEITNNTTVKLDGGVQNVEETLVKGLSQAKITTIGIGGAGAGNAGIAGSVAVNQINNNTAVSLSNVNLTAKGNVGVIAQNDETISNYAGTLGVAGQGAGIGAAVSINEISGDTSATIEKSNVIARGETDKSIEVNGKISKVDNELCEDIDIDYTLSSERETESKKGLVLDSSATHTIKSLIASGGIAGQGAGIGGTVNVNSINGSTVAGVLNSAINQGIENASDVSIHSGDYSKSIGIVGALGVAGQGAGIGAASDTNIIERKAGTFVDNSNIFGNNIGIDADSKHAISSFSAGGAVAGIGAGVAGTVSVTQLDGETVVDISNNSEIEAKNNLDVKANNVSDVVVGNTSVGVGGVGAGVGTAVGVTQDNTTTKVSINRSELTSGNEMNIDAENRSKLDTLLVSAGAGAGGVSGTISVNNITNKVITDIANSNLLSQNSNLNINSKNDINTSITPIGASAGGIGVTGVVTVNTINSSALTTIAGGSVTAEKGNIEVTATEERDLDQTTVSAAVGATVALGANVAINSIGTAAVDREDTNIGQTIAEINKEQENKFSGNALIENFVKDKDYKVNANSGKAYAEDEGIRVELNSTLMNARNINLEAKEVDNINITGGGASGGLVSASGSVGITDIARKLGINVKDSDLTATQKLSGIVQATGKVKGELYQGSAGAIGLGAAYGEINTTGETLVNISGSTLKGNNIDISAKDNTAIENEAIGLTGGVIAAGAIIAKADNNSSVGVTIGDNDKFVAGEKVSVKAEKENKITSIAKVGSVGIASGAGADASVIDKGNSKITIGTNNTFSANADGIQEEEKESTIEINAVNDSVARAESSGLVAGLVAVGGNLAKAQSNTNVTLDIASGNTFKGKNTTLTAENKNNITADTAGVGGGAVGVNYNEAKAINNGNVNVNIDKQNYLSVMEEARDRFNDLYERRADNTVKISGINSANLTALTDGVMAGIVSSGNNRSITENTASTIVTVKGAIVDNKKAGSDDGKIGNLQVKANTVTNANANSDGSGGGIISIDGMAARAENNISSDTIVNISGDWDINNKMVAEALDSSNVTLNADSRKAAVVGYSGTTTKNTIKNKSEGTKVNFGGNVVGIGEVSTLAKNTSNVTINSMGSGYGGITVNGTSATNRIDKDANINITGKVLTDKQQTYEAFADNNININGYVATAGLGASTIVSVKNELVNDNNVTLAKGAELKTDKKDQDITLSASDNLTLNLNSKAEVKTGAAGGASADTVNSSTRNNRVTANGYIRSMDDINLYAGKNVAGHKAELTANVAAEAYNSAFIAITDPTLENKFYQNNLVTVGTVDGEKNGNIEGVKDINISAADGQIRLKESKEEYTWTEGKDKTGSYVSSSSGKIEDPNNSLVRNNEAILNGKLTAGIQNEQKITIDGLVDFDIKDGKPGIGNIAGALNKPIITASEEVDISKIDYGIIDDFGKELKTQYDYYNRLMGEYKTLGDTKAYAGFKAERDRIANRMEELGLGFKDQNGKFILTGELSLPTITIPDIVASGGNIVIDTDNLTGKGELTAKGAPKIEVINNSNLYLQISDLTISGLGGEIKFKGTSIGDGGLDLINKLNSGKTAEFATVKTSPKGDAKILVQNNWNEQVDVIVDENNNISKMDVLSGVQINGDIKNLEGTVEVEIKKGDILIQGETSGGAGGSINAETIKLTAVGGSVSQGFTNGIKNIGSDPLAPESWGNLSDQIIKDNITGKLDQDENKHETFYGDKQQNNNSKGIIASGDIYINATDINVNGTIQSGFESYNLELTSNDMDKINSLRDKWIAAGRPDITMDDTIEEYKINAGNKADGKNYVIQAYYNPQTDEIVIKDIESKGGHIYLTGRISSTGGGNIVALDGATNVDIKNNTDKNLQVNGISNGNAKGLISITDTIGDRTITTEYTRDKIEQFEYKTVTDKETGEKVIERVKLEGNELTQTDKNKYSPDEGLRYNWAEGSKTENGERYSWERDFSLWGLIKYDADEIHDKLKDQSIVESIKPRPDVKAEDGTYIGKVEGLDSNRDFGLVFDNNVGSQSTVITRDETEYDNWTHFSGTQYYEWEYKWSSGQTYLSSVKADRDINIGFIGSENGTINIEGNKNISLNGNIKNNNSSAVTTISSLDGKISQTAGANIYSNNINMSAKKGIENINITSVGTKDNDIVNIKAITDSGNIGINVKGGMSNNMPLAANVNIDQISTNSGQVSLSTLGNINQKGIGVSVTGNRIDLVSRDGNIDLVVQGGTEALTAAESLNNSINAQAKGDINLTQNNGDFRIGKVYSDTGDVEITVNNGNLVDALPTGNNLSNETTEEKIQKWKDMGLITSDNSESTKQEKLAQDIKDFEENVRISYENYSKLDQQKESYFAMVDSNEELSAAEKTELKANYENRYQETKKGFEAKYGEWATADEYLANNSYQEKIEDTQWTIENLLYAIKEDMANPEGGSTMKELKDPNISGTNIKINVVNGGVGVDAGQETVSLENLNQNVEVLKKLASSEVADVTWGETEAIITHKNPIGIQMKKDGNGDNGSLNITAQDNIYLAARTDVEGGSTQTNTIYVDNINTSGDIRLLGTDGVYNVSSTGNNFTGNNLVLEGGRGDLGEVEKALTMNLAGSLTARTDGSMYLNQTAGDMNVAAIYAGRGVNLVSAGNIFSSNVNVGESAGSTSGSSANEEDENLVLGYINAGKGIALEATEDIGTTSQGLNILNGKEYAVDATGKNIYLNGKKEGEFLLGNITAQGNVGINSEDSIKVAGNIKGKDVTLTAGTKENQSNSITLGGEGNSIIDVSDLTMTAIAGNINQQATNTINANTVVTQAKTGINLGTETNKFNTITLGNETGDILVNNSGENGLAVTFDTTQNSGNIEINNTTGDMSVSGKDGNLEVVGEENSIIFTNETGDITVNNTNLTAGKDIGITTDTGDITTTGNITATTGNIDIALNNAKETGISISNNLVAGTNVNVSTTTGDIGVTGDIKGGTDVDLTTNSGSIESVGNVGAGNDVAFNTVTGDITVNKDNNDLAITSGNNFTAQADEGTITIGGQVNSGNEAKVETTLNGDININDIISKNDIYVLTNIGNINVNHAESIDGKVYIKSSTEGSITVDNIKTNTTVDVLTNVGDIDINKLEANDMVNIMASTEGNINSDISLKSVNESLKVYSAKGDVTLNDVYAEKVAEVIAKDGNIYIKKINGDYVIITLGKMDKEMIVEEQIVGKGTILSSNDVTIDNLFQREGETTPVGVTFKNSEDNIDAPIDYAELHAKGLENGVFVNQLWVNNAEITTDGDILQFPELVVTGIGHFANSSTTTTVYGKDSSFDSSNIHIWNDADKKEWIVLNFLPQENSIYTDGRLLKLQDRYIVFDQRVTAEDYMIEHLKDYVIIEHKLNEIKEPFKYLYRPYLRYDLIDNNLMQNDVAKVIRLDNGKIIIEEKEKITELTLEPSIKIDSENDEKNVAINEK